MIVSVLGVAAAVVLGALSALHVYWAVGGRAGTAAVIPTVDGRPTLAPSTLATLVVALLLALSAFLLLGAVADWEPTWLFRTGCGGLGLVLLARAIGDFRTVGFTKRVRDTEFARRDATVYSPLCLALGVAAAVVALASG